MIARSLTRCPDGFYPGCCPSPTCEHYDGTGEGRAPIDPRYVYCVTCEQATDRETAVPCHHGTTWRCHECAHCPLCRTNPRHGRRKYCNACYRILTAPKPCERCGKLMRCKPPIEKTLSQYMKQTKHLKCSIDEARKGMAFK